MVRSTYYPTPSGVLVRKAPKLPALKRGGARCADCKQDAPGKGEHHVCIGGRCTTCLPRRDLRAVGA